MRRRLPDHWMVINRPPFDKDLDSLAVDSEAVSVPATDILQLLTSDFLTCDHRSTHTGNVSPGSNPSFRAYVSSSFPSS
jgi:hypothetical protein